jgi:endonuclease YncB( thermonuclease family)
MIVDRRGKISKRAPPARRPVPRRRRAGISRGRFSFFRRGYGRLYIMLLALLAYGFWSGGETERVAAHAHVIDGDSLRLGDFEIRIEGVDAPEMRQFCRRAGLDYRCGVEAREALVALIGHFEVECAVSGRDRYGRKLARCLANGRDLGLEMVRSGHAVAYGGYEAEEAAARRARLGIWSGEFEPPAEWRASAEAEPAGS